LYRGHVVKQQLMELSVGAAGCRLGSGPHLLTKQRCTGTILDILATACSKRSN
jgi:hypothetical protein